MLWFGVDDGGAIELCGSVNKGMSTGGFLRAIAGVVAVNTDDASILIQIVAFALTIFSRNLPFTGASSARYQVAACMGGVMALKLVAYSARKIGAKASKGGRRQPNNQRMHCRRVLSLGLMADSTQTRSKERSYFDEVRKSRV